MHNTYISYFSRKELSTPDNTVNLLSICTTKHYKTLIELLRSYPKGSKEHTKLKNALPCFTPSIICSVRKISGIISHTRKIALDFDNVVAPDDLKRQLSRLDFIEFASLSCSGTGIFAIVPIKSADKHRQYFDALVAHFAKDNIIVDKSGSDITRCRFVSYDANYYYNPHASEWDNILPSSPHISSTTQHISTEYYTNKEERLIYAVHEYVTSTHTDITKGRTNWLVLASFIAQTLGASGRFIFHDISQYHPRYNKSECDKTYTAASLYTRHIHIGAIVNILNNYNLPLLKYLLKS